MKPNIAEAHRILGVAPPLTLESLRAAWRQCALRHHPDRGGEVEAFQRLTLAYELLSDHLADGPASSRATAGEPWAPPPANPTPRHRPQSEGEPDLKARWKHRAPATRARKTPTRGRRRPWPSKPKRSVKRSAPPRPRPVEAAPEAPSEFQEQHAEADAHAEVFARWRNASGRSEPQEAPAKAGFVHRLKAALRGSPSPAGRDTELRLPLDMATVLTGGSRLIAVERLAACPSCAGERECLICEGRGRIKVREKVRVDIPAGARGGARLRLAGKGMAGLEGAPDGDLYLLLEPEELPGFRREGTNLHGLIELQGHFAAAGGNLRVGLPGHKVQLEVPAGTRAGDRFRLRGQGLPNWGGGPRGDLYLVVGIVG